jgi:hypothetical protein
VVLSLGNIPKESVPSLAFSNFSRIYLLRTDPEDLGKRIVLDQFEVGGDVARVTQGQEGTLQSQERAAVARFAGVGNLVSPWYAPIPAVDESFEGDHSLGQDNALATLDPGVRPVEVLFADTGRLSEDEASAIPASFPTTGSMLLLMRYANRPMSDNPPDYKYAFTSHLRSGPGSVVQAQYQIDNGRMPVFDTGMVHHYDPAFDPITGLQWPVRRPGELAHLPWGQFVFDYFTALPLSNPGPYRDESTSSIDPGARPRVDQDGLRVHGRININAAPWKVLSGLPFVPLEDIPAAFRTTFGVTLALVDNNGLAIADDDAGWLGEERAKAIVAYREARKVSGLDAGGNLFTTGDYGDDPTAQGRGWTRDIPMARRGTGFMTVGELANVRNAGATSDLYKLDSGKLDDTSATYLEAIAVLASLGDWVTARSHVFTIYGTLRGQEDQTIVDPNLEVQTRLRAEDVDSRAIRFQETVDRLPTFMGEHQPVRVGDRVVGKYRDTLND